MFFLRAFFEDFKLDFPAKIARVGFSCNFPRSHRILTRQKKDRKRRARAFDPFLSRQNPTSSRKVAPDSSQPPIKSPKNHIKSKLVLILLTGLGVIVRIIILGLLSWEFLVE